MNRIFLLLFLVGAAVASAQSDQDAVEFGILPSEYGEGMPPEEFLQIEERIVDAIRRVPRFKILKTQEDYYDVELGDDWTTQIEMIRKQGVQSNVPYLLQIVFGDTEWTSEIVEVVKVKAVIKDGKEVTPAKKEKFWTHTAGLWVTLNFYKVETGELEESLTFTTKVKPSTSQVSQARTKPKPIRDFKMAVDVAKPVLLSRVTSGLRNLVPFKVRLLDPIEQSDKSISTIAVNAGTFHGLKVKDRLYVYYENEHLVNGKKVIREINAGTLVIEEVKERTAVCKVKKGNKKLKKLLNEGKQLKCGYKNFYGWADGYGF